MASNVASSTTPKNKKHSDTPLLDKISQTADLRGLSDDELETLSSEVRTDLIRIVSQTGGHLGAGLGVVELTVALHHVFNTPDDRLIWDVGHQAYPHKILTGRRDRMLSLRQKDGLSGFTKRSESVYDTFGTGHSSTSISAGLGMAIGSEIQGQKRNVISVIGDGAISAGMAYEAMNNAGAQNANLIVILNDNDMSIAPPTGAMSAYLARLVSGRPYQSLRDTAKHIVEKMPRFINEKAARVEEYARGFWTGGTLFEELGFYYIGPVDGHNLSHLLPVLRNARDMERGPILIHVVTKKGKGYPPAEKAADKYHGVGKFDIVSGTQAKKSSNAPSYTSVFGDALVREATRDDKIIGVTAAMPSGTGLEKFGEKFPKRIFDVGIAEQHAVTFCAGLATEGLKPFVAIYSTFLQRAYDQIVHDVAIQKLPVRFPIDRAGYVGADGPTHAGSFDTAFLAALPNMVVMAASDEAELSNMVHTAALYDEGPISFRYPRGEGVGIDIPSPPVALEIGKGRIVKQGSKIALLSFGTRLKECLLAAEILATYGLSTTVADARFAKPLDEQLVTQLASHHELLLTVEEGAVGGFGSHVLHHCAQSGLLDTGLKIRSLGLPDSFTDHANPDDMYASALLDAKGIAKTALDVLGIEVKKTSKSAAPRT